MSLPTPRLSLRTSAKKTDLAAGATDRRMQWQITHRRVTRERLLAELRNDGVDDLAAQAAEAATPMMFAAYVPSPVAATSGTPAAVLADEPSSSAETSPNRRRPVSGRPYNAGAVSDLMSMLQRGGYADMSEASWQYIACSPLPMAERYAEEMLQAGLLHRLTVVVDELKASGEVAGGAIPARALSDIDALLHVFVVVMVHCPPSLAMTFVSGGIVWLARLAMTQQGTTSLISPAAHSLKFLLAKDWILHVAAVVDDTASRELFGFVSFMEANLAGQDAPRRRELAMLLSYCCATPLVYDGSDRRPSQLQTECAKCAIRLITNTYAAAMGVGDLAGGNGHRPSADSATEVSVDDDAPPTYAPPTSPSQGIGRPAAPSPMKFSHVDDDVLYYCFDALRRLLNSAWPASSSFWRFVTSHLPWRLVCGLAAMTVDDGTLDALIALLQAGPIEELGTPEYQQQIRTFVTILLRKSIFRTGALKLAARYFCHFANVDCIRSLIEPHTKAMELRVKREAIRVVYVLCREGFATTVASALDNFDAASAPQLLVDVDDDVSSMVEYIIDAMMQCDEFSGGAYRVVDDD